MAAVEALKKAADQGNAVAQYNLGTSTAAANSERAADLCAFISIEPAAAAHRLESSSYDAIYD